MRFRDILHRTVIISKYDCRKYSILIWFISTPGTRKKPKWRFFHETQEKPQINNLLEPIFRIILQNFHIYKIKKMQSKAQGQNWVFGPKFENGSNDFGIFFREVHHRSHNPFCINVLYIKYYAFSRYIT